MALLDFEGFDNIKSGTAEAGIFTGVANPTNSPGVFEFGKYLGNDSSNTTCTIPFPSQLTTFFVNFHYRVDVQTDTTYIAQFRETLVNDQLYIGLDTGKIVVKRGGSTGTLLATSANTGYIFLSDTWHFVQIKVTISNTVGICIVKVDGVEWINLSNADTQNAASNAYCDAIYWFSAPTDIRVDNYVLYDTTGGVFDDFSAETRVRGQKPNSAGATTDWTPLSSTNVSNVDEEYDADTTYNSTDVLGEVDLYAYASPTPAAATVHGVKVGTTFRKDDTGTNTANNIVRSNSVNYEDPNGPYAALATYVYNSWVMTVDPNTSAAWTYSAANTLQNGIIRKT